MVNVSLSPFSTAKEISSPDAVPTEDVLVNV